MAAIAATGRRRNHWFHVVEPDDGGGGVAQGFTFEGERFAGLLLVETLQLAGFGREHRCKFGASLAGREVRTTAVFSSRRI